MVYEVFFSCPDGGAGAPPLCLADWRSESSSQGWGRSDGQARHADALYYIPPILEFLQRQQQGNELGRASSVNV